LSSGWARQGIVNQPLLCDDTNIQRSKAEGKKKNEKGKEKRVAGDKNALLFCYKKSKGKRTPTVDML